MNSVAVTLNKMISNLVNQQIIKKITYDGKREFIKGIQGWFKYLC